MSAQLANTGSPTADQDPSGLGILVVDDEPSFRSSLRRLFRCMSADAAFGFHETGDGEEALRILDSERVDCVLLDFRLGRRSGLEYLEEMLKQHPNLAVVMVTGHGDEETAVSALKKGAIDYLVKGSITPEGLRRAILNAVEKVRMRIAIEVQRKQLMEAERQRVMIQSLGAACHHLGQPATVIACALELMRAQKPPSELMELIKTCLDATDTIGKIIQQLQQISTYRTVPYRPLGDSEPSRPDERILDICAATRT